ncbi:MAG TPA: hypothetical protein VGM75_12475 [Pseudonocardiaceae bacterium]
MLEPVATLADGSAIGQPGLGRRSEPGFGVTTVGVDEQAGRGRQWRIRCQDVANRERFLTVLVEHGRVVLVGPPGETAVLTSGQLNQLRAVLHEAAEEAER